METSSAKHKILGAGVFCILVGRFEMHEWEGDLKLEGFATEFMLPGELHATMGRSNIALPMHFGLAPNSIFIQVCERQAPQTQDKTMIMHVKSACAEGVLR